MSFFMLIIACQGHISGVTVIFEFSNGFLKFLLKLFFYKFDDSGNSGDSEKMVILVNMVIYVNLVMLVNHVILLNLVFFLVMLVIFN